MDASTTSGTIASKGNTSVLYSLMLSVMEIDSGTDTCGGLRSLLIPIAAAVHWSTSWNSGTG
jgi:hypothetical protein